MGFYNSSTKRVIKLHFLKKRSSILSDIYLKHTCFARIVYVLKAYRLVIAFMTKVLGISKTRKTKKNVRPEQPVLNGKPE